MRPNGIPEQRIVVAPAEPVGSSFLLVGPPDGEVIEGRDLVVDDRVLADSRAHDGIAPSAEGIEELLHPRWLDHDSVVRHTSLTRPDGRSGDDRPKETYIR